MAVYVYDIRNERTIKKNDRTEEQGNERTNEPWSSKRRHHEFFDFSSTPPPPLRSFPVQPLVPMINSISKKYS